MKSNIIFLLLLIPLFSDAQGKWQSITDPTGQFAVELYGNIISLEMDTARRNDTVIIHHLMQSEVQNKSHDNSYYTLSISTFNPKIIHSDSSLFKISQYLDASAPKLSDVEKAKTLTTTLEFKNGYPGKVYESSFKQGDGNSQLIYRAFMIQNHLVQLGIISRPDRWHNQSSSRFFDSFRLNNIPKNERNYGLASNQSRSFEIEFPGEVQKDTRFLDSQLGTMAFQINIHERKEKVGNIVFIATELKYPEGFMLEEDQLDNFFDESVKGSLANTNGSLIEKNKMKIGGHEGVAFKMSLYEGNMWGYYRSVYVDKRIYTIGVLSTFDKLDEEAKEFLNSFKLKI